MNDKTKPTGRPFGKVVRIHKTYWVSEEEDRFITGYLRQHRKITSSASRASGRNRFAEKEERIREQQNEIRHRERKRVKILRDYEKLLRMRDEDNDG